MKWALLFLITAAVHAQEPTFRTRAHEVIVPVSVMTKDGKPVEGLGAEDFLVLDVIRYIGADNGGSFPDLC
jgi:hypothetical protein